MTGPGAPAGRDAAGGRDGAAAGWEVASAACEAAGAALGGRLISAYAIGSLAHGGFSPAVSDIDVALLVDRCDDALPAAVAAIAQATQDRLGPGLAERLSLFYADWPTFAAPPPTARMGAIDRLDLMEHGVLLAGADRRTTDGSVPSREELIAQTADFLARWAAQLRDPQRLIDAGPRALTKAVLFPVRFLYTHATGRAGSNQAAVEWYRAERRPHAALADAALAWRTGEVDRRLALRLLGEHLEGLCRECRRAFGA